MHDLQLPAAAGRQRWWALGALAVSVLVVGLDLFVLSLALPTLAVDLHASTGDLQWFIDSYSLVLAAALLPAGLLGDRIGRKKMLIGALSVFGLASLACAYSASTRELIAARAVLGSQPPSSCPWRSRSCRCCSRPPSGRALSRSSAARRSSAIHSDP